MRGIEPAVLVRENNMPLLRYSLDTNVSYSTIISLDFQVSERLHRRPEFSPIYLVNYIIIT